MYKISAINSINVCNELCTIVSNMILISNLNGLALKPMIDSVIQSKGVTHITYKYDNPAYHTKISIRECNNSLIFSIDADFDKEYLLKKFPPFPSLDRDRGIVLRFKSNLGGGFFANYMETYWWSNTEFKDIPERTQRFAINHKGTHTVFFALCTLSHKAQFCMNGEYIDVYIGSEAFGSNGIHGDFMIISSNEDIYKASINAQHTATSTIGFLAPLRSAKKYPEFLETVGWCTWNACYHDVTAEKIEMKLKELQEKNISLGWLLIDDGWHGRNNNWELTSFYADKEKFPDGLGKFISYIKSEYGVKYVGVWHSFIGYWWGIEKNSDVARTCADCLITTNNNTLLPDYTNTEKMFSFYDKWHSYLEEEGVDFVKVDTQGELCAFARDNFSVVEATRNCQLALEKSVKKHFNNNIINCMGMGIENTSFRPYSSLIRSSDDFYPDKIDSFSNHLIQNAYNSFFFNELYYCDYDMWWTNQLTSVQSGVLRAISGGPVYISDELGFTSAEMLAPLINENGVIYRCDSSALPARDNIYSPKNIIKLMNTAKGVNVLALFNTAEQTATTTITEKDLKNPVGGCVAYLYFEKKFIRLDNSFDFDVTLNHNACEIISFYPVTDDTIMLGDTTKYLSPIAKPEKTSIEKVM